MDPFHIRVLTRDDASIYRDLRIHALSSSPEAFSTTVGEYEKRSLSDVSNQLCPTEDKFTLGAWIAPNQLVGIVTFVRETQPKLRHRGNVFAMFVSASARRQGLARALLQTLLAQAEQMDGLEQLHLSVVTSNKSAVKLYESLGFRTFAIDEKANKVDTQYWDEAQMVRWLRLENTIHLDSDVGQPQGITQVNHVTLNVSNLSLSIDFYVQTLGLTLVHRGRFDAYLESGSVWVCLQERAGVRPSAPYLGVDHVAFSISSSDWDAAVARLHAANVVIVRGPIYRGGGQTVSFLDLDGTPLELFTGTLTDRMKEWN